MNWKCVWSSEWTAQFSVCKTTGKDSFEACAIACQNCAVYSVFPLGMTSHSKIAQFNWECIGRLTCYELAHVDFVCSASVRDFLYQIRKHSYIYVIFSRYILMKDSNQLFPQQLKQTSLEIYFTTCIIM